MKRTSTILLLAFASVAVAQERPKVEPGTESGQDLRAPADDDSFRFVVFGDRTGGRRSGLKVLRDAVTTTNHLDPALVMTVGDMIQGYNREAKWLREMREFKGIMDGLRMPWYPVAGNHDVYARPRKPGGHLGVYKEHFGPLYYSFDYKWAHFVVLFTDEALNFHDPAKNQNMSAEQLAWLKADLAKTKAEQVFVFLHHPRWLRTYTGCNWGDVHQTLASDGRVRAVFAGHIHVYRDDGQRDGIHYYTLATTGGHRPRLDSAAFDHLNLITVRRGRMAMSVVPIGSTFGPDVVKGPELDAIYGLSRGGWLEVHPGAQQAVSETSVSSFSIELRNPTDRPLRAECQLSQPRGWKLTHGPLKLTLAPGSSQELQIQARAEPLQDTFAPAPRVTARVTYTLASGREQPVEVTREVPVLRSGVEAFARDARTQNQALLLEGDGAVRVPISLEGLQQFTLECWVRGSTPQGRMALIAKTERSSLGLFWGESNRSRPAGMVYLRGKGYLTAASSGWTYGRWTHVALVYDGKRIRLFVDGAQQSEAEGAGQIVFNGQPLYIGADPNGRGQPTSHFRGAIDDVRLSRIARYTAPFEPAQRHLADDDTLLLLRCDTQIGELLPDMSGKGNHGVLVGKAKLSPDRTWQ